MRRSAPESVVASATAILDSESLVDRTVFLARLDRYWADLLDGLTDAYGERAPDLAAAVVDLAARAYAERPQDLRLLDLRRHVEPDWFQNPAALGYAVYADRFAGDLQGVIAKVPYLAELGVTYLHLMPLLKPRPRPNDGGYAVMDYRRVREDLGTFDDIVELAGVLRGEGISLTLDLVLNHVAAEHEWAVRARAGEERYRAYFHVFPDRMQPDAFERTLPEVFPDFAPGNFTWNEELEAWVWTTFNSWQWDLNWHNPDVFCEFADLVCFLANRGVECLRLDAIAFMWKRLGTDCQNQPEVHSLTQALHAVTRIAAPAVVFKAEAIVAPKQLVPYLGQGRHYGKVSDLAYHNTLMVQVWSALAARDARLMTEAIRRFPRKPATTSWATYVRCHDDIGWAISDDDAAAVGLNGALHRRFLSDFYSGAFPGSFARGLVFQENKVTGDR
ncbi:MAG TPA: alpha-amylase family glycosyl hydrolase, partial [Actinomycetes bacterium]|nr:alpha-amylase family glycosyl hydrolase [Actinomycetes bacterium]